MIMKSIRKFKKAGKSYLVDTSSSIIYGNMVFGPIEIFTNLSKNLISDGNIQINFDQILATRERMSLMALLIARPYGKFRNYWAKNIWGIKKESSRLTKYAADVSGNLLFYGGIYTLASYCSDRTPEEFVAALGLAAITTAITGRPYGMFMDKVREKFGIEPAMPRYNSLEGRVS
jgi:hypothetical protein